MAQITFDLALAASDPQTISVYDAADAAGLVLTQDIVYQIQITNESDTLVYFHGMPDQTPPTVGTTNAVKIGNTAFTDDKKGNVWGYQAPDFEFPLRAKECFIHAATAVTITVFLVGK